MFGSDVIDVGVGIALLFLFMSLIATALREIIENFLKTRSKDLERGITEMLVQPGESSSLVADFYRHPLVAALYKGDYVAGARNLPSYIPRQSFSLALLDILANASAAGHALSVGELRSELANASVPNGVQRVVLTALGTAGQDLALVRAALEDWYDGTMDRVSGWYARRTDRILALIGFGAAVFFNVDAITVAQHLISDKALRMAAVSSAMTIVSAGPSGEGAAATAADEFAARAQMLEAIGFPMGWQADGWYLSPKPQTCRRAVGEGARPGSSVCDIRSGWLTAFFGWVITALAIMLGAPFWFDVLNRFMVVRSTVKPKEKSPDEAPLDGPQARASGPSPGPVAAADG